MGDIERLEREIRDNNQRMQNALARIRRTAFGPSTYQFYDGFSDAAVPKDIEINGDSTMTRFLAVFPGSIVGLGVIADSAYSGAAGSNYNDFTVKVNGTATAATVRLAGGSSSAYATFSKGEALIAEGDVITVGVAKTGTPVPVSLVHSLVVWVSNT